MVDFLTHLESHCGAIEMGLLLIIVLRFFYDYLMIWASWFRTSNGLGSCY